MKRWNPNYAKPDWDESVVLAEGGQLMLYSDHEREVNDVYAKCSAGMAAAITERDAFETALRDLLEEATEIIDGEWGGLVQEDNEAFKAAADLLKGRIR